MVRLANKVIMCMLVCNGVARVLALSLLTFACGVSATMRCGTSLISEGDSAQAILNKCGEPAKKTSQIPAIRGNGVPKMNAAKISILVYGPYGGAYRYLRFIDDKLIAIETSRN